jgi:uncharacterized repeat protein (TIGR03803 family)
MPERALASRLRNQNPSRIVNVKHRTTLICFVAALFCGSVLFRLCAQSNTFNLIYTFTSANGDGVGPFGGLIISSNTLYCTTDFGGSAHVGTVFSVNTDGSGISNLYSFPGGEGGIGSDFGVTIADNTLFGTTSGGGSGDSGTVFRLNTDGSDFTNLYDFSATIGPFTNSDGVVPGGLTLSGSTLFGITIEGGWYGSGTVFRVNTDGSDFTNLHNFASNDGVNFVPGSGHLILSGNTLFGTAPWSGSDGCVFSLNIDGSNFTNLYSFTNGADGASPCPDLILSGNTLYGTAYNGGTNGNGTVFSLNTNGLGFTVLHSFAATSGNANGYYVINSDGAQPMGLVLSGSTLYGTTEQGVATGYGTVYRMNTNGTEFSNLYNFTGGSDGSLPDALLLSGNTLYGTASGGGSGQAGTIFALTLPLPTLVIAPTASQVVISWPASAPNFVLQTAPDLSLGSWSNIASGIFTNGPNCVLTNTLNSQAAFFRLQQAP